MKIIFIVVICNLQKKNIYICENCYKNKEKCEEDLIHEHPIIFIPKNGVELIRKRDDIHCIVENKDYYNLREKCENCGENITDFCWECAECKFCLCN